MHANKWLQPFPFGVHYYRYPSPPPAEWAADFAHIARLGFGFVQIRLQWRACHQRAQRIDWTEVDRFFKLAENNNLKVVVQFGQETTPQWVINRHNCKRQAANGTTILPSPTATGHLGGDLPCFQHPGWRRECAKFAAIMIRRYREKPNLLGWSIWNEPRARGAVECACPHCTRQYQAWCRQKFSSIEKYNRLFGKAWGSFREIHAPATLHPSSICSDLTENYLWKLWALDALTGRVAWMHRIFKRLDPEHPAFAHSGAGALVGSMATDGAGDYALSRRVDAYGQSVVSRRKNPFFTEMQSKWARDIMGPYLAWELYPADGFWRSRGDGSEFRLLLATALACGAQAACVWQFKPERTGLELADAGLVGLDGSATPQSQVAAETIAWVRKHSGDIPRASALAAQVGLLYQQKTHIYASLLDQRLPELRPADGYHPGLWGAFTAWRRLHYGVRWFCAEDLAQINSVPLLYCVEPWFIDAPQALALRAYVERGGVLVCEPSPGLMEESTFLAPKVPARGLDTLFGAREIRRVLDPKGRWPLKFAGSKAPITAERLQAAFECRGAECLARWQDGACAATFCRQGKGAAILLGFHPSKQYWRSLPDAWPHPPFIWPNEDFAALSLFAQLAQRAGINPGLRVAAPRAMILSTLLRAAAGRRWVWLLNYSSISGMITAEPPADWGQPETIRSPAGCLVKAKGRKLVLNMPAREWACIRFGENQEKRR